MLKSVSIIMNANDEMLSMMAESLRIHDQALYYQRQAYFETKEQGKIKTYSYNELWNLVKETEAYTGGSLDIGPKTYAIRQVANEWQAFIKATMAYRKNPSKFTGRPKMPGYLYKKKEYNIVQVDSGRFRTKHCRDNEVRLPNGKTVLRFPKWLKRGDIHQITFSIYYGKIKVNFIYEDLRYIDNRSDSGCAAGIDLGVDNLMAITINDKPFSCVVNGRPLKSMNQYYNKKLSKLRSQLDKCNKNQKTSKRIQKLTMDRNHKVDHYIHCASRQVLGWCVEHGVETIVIGHNDGWKQDVNLGHRNNQNFVQIPFSTLINQFQYKSEKYLNLNVVIVEESYTSKTDHLALEEMCHHDEYMGKRVERGLFKSSTGVCLNADINGAVGMLRKGNVISEDQLMVLRDRGDVVSPRVFRLNL